MTSNLLPILNDSLKRMKEFITFIINKLKKNAENKEDKQIMFLTEKIFKFMLNNSEKLGIPFFYLLVNENEFTNILMNSCGLRDMRHVYHLMKQ